VTQQGMGGERVYEYQAALPDEGLVDLLARRGLGHRVPAILRVTRPCVWLETCRDDDAQLPVGTSKLGGAPDLPPAVTWPTWHERPLAFLAQIRLEEVRACDEAGDLPAAGLLSFFCAHPTGYEPQYGDDEDDFDPASWRVLFLQENLSALARRLPPTTLPAESQFAACSMSPSRLLTLPSVDGPEYETMGLTNQERHIYIDITSGRDEAGEFHSFDKGTYLLGHPYDMDDSALVQGYTSAYGSGNLISPSPERDWRALERAAAAEWRLLFQTDGGSSDIDVWGGGVLHVSIRWDDLRARVFERVVFDVDFI
jgi:uncharacterized protein YwqG